MRSRPNHGASETDLLVVGAGPAGLAAACAAIDSGLTVTVLERGVDRPSRDRADPIDVGSGVGGAGLFSDGKFSFWPSATKLWELAPSDDLEEAYHWLLRQVRDQDWTISSHRVHAPTDQPPIAGVRDKRYPSFYMSLADRAELIDAMAERLQASLVTNTEVLEVQYKQAYWIVQTSDQTELSRWKARTLVLTAGRFDHMNLKPPSGRLTSGRLEVGVRIEQPDDSFLLRDHPATDPKLIVSTSAGLEVRTFCCCRSGEVTPVDIGGRVTVSGRADVEKTGRSNVGFVVRLPVDTVGLETLSRCLDARSSLIESGSDFLGVTGPIAERLGPAATEAIREAIAKVAGQLHRPLPGDEAIVWGVAIEGLGEYPLLHDDLRWGPDPVWVAGDATGRFRGLTAALISGYFVGLQARATLEAG